MRRNDNGSYTLTLADINADDLLAAFDPTVDTVDAYLARIQPELEARLQRVLEAAAADAETR